MAVTFRVKYGLKTPDAVQIATAAVSGADYIITNDKKWKKIKEVHIVLLSELYFPAEKRDRLPI
jgi:predicted nucleic acid-binding protein